MTIFLLTEKPDASKRIADALSGDKSVKKLNKTVPYYELKYKNKKVIVVCAVGHLYNLTEKTKTQDYPNFDVVWKESYLINKSAAFTKKYLDTIKILSKNVDEYYLATDKDTEGELIGYNIFKFACKINDAKRMEFSTLTKTDLIKAFENPKSHIDFSLVESGETRHILDFFYGINSSRALTSAVKSAGQFKILSSGRVQSPTLTLLAKRELEIEEFKPEPYWQIFAFIKVNNNLLGLIHKEDKFWKKNEAENRFNKCNNKDALVKKIIRKEYEVLPVTPFNITTLQTESYKLFNFSPKKTLDIAQSLYINAYISYPRTSSEKLPVQINYKEILEALAKIKEFKKYAESILSKKTLTPHEGKKIDPAHDAIRPTSSIPDLNELSDDEKKIYSLIAKRFISVFADNALRESLEVNFNINKEIFLAKGARTIKTGWISFYEPYAKFKEVTLPDFKENEIYKVDSLNLKEDQTKPPKRYTQGSIIAEMDKRGLGTRATRSNILQILYDRNYIEESSIKVTELGKVVAKTLEKYVPDLVSEDLTRDFEEELELIREKKKKKEEIIEKAKEVLIKILKKFKDKEKDIGKDLLKAVRETQEQASVVGKCKNCGKNLKIVYSRKNQSYFISCENWKVCNTTFSLTRGLPKPTGELCECGYPTVKMIRKGKRPYNFCINRDCPKKQEWINKNNI